MQGKPLSSTSCKYFYFCNYCWNLPLFVLELTKTPFMILFFFKSDEWGGPHVAHHRKQCGRNSGEEHTLPDVGYWRAGVSQVLLEHLLLQHRGEHTFCLLFSCYTLRQMRANRGIVQQWGFFGSWCVCSEHRRQQGPPKSEVSLSQRRLSERQSEGQNQSVFERKSGESHSRGRCVRDLKESFYKHMDLTFLMSHLLDTCFTLDSHPADLTSCLFHVLKSVAQQRLNLHFGPFTPHNRSRVNTEPHQFTHDLTFQLWLSDTSLLKSNAAFHQELNKKFKSAAVL